MGKHARAERDDRVSTYHEAARMAINTREGK